MTEKLASSEIAQSRERFEKFVQDRGGSIEKHLGGTTYRWTDVQLAWEAWERAIAESQAPQPELLTTAGVMLSVERYNELIAAEHSNGCPPFRDLAEAARQWLVKNGTTYVMYDQEEAATVLPGLMAQFATAYARIITAKGTTNV